MNHLSQVPFVKIISQMQSLVYLLISLVCCYSNNYKLGKLEEFDEAVIPLTGKLFDIVSGVPRNYTLYVLLTTTYEEHACKACHEIAPEYQLVAEGWKRLGREKEVYFSVADFPAAPEVFQTLEIQSVPKILRFPPTSGDLAIKGAYDSYELEKKYSYLTSGFGADKLAQYVNQMYDAKIVVARPVDYTPMIFTGIAVAFVLVTLKLAFKKLTTFVFGKGPWILLVLSVSVIMTSGYMWNTIRTPPFIAQGRNGSPAFIADGFQNQFGVETIIVAALCI